VKTIAYLRVSSEKQDVDSQRLAILDYAQRQKLPIDEFVEISVSSRRSPAERGLGTLLARLEDGDLLIVSELSRLGRSVGQVITLVHELVRRGVVFTAIKENIQLGQKRYDLQGKVMVTMFGLFAEIERDLISERTKAGLATARAQGKLLGRPPGTFRSRLDACRAEIEHLLSLKVSKASIAKIVGCSRTALVSFLKRRGMNQNNRRQGQ